MELTIYLADFRGSMPELLLFCRDGKSAGGEGGVIDSQVAVLFLFLFMGLSIQWSLIALNVAVTGQHVRSFQYSLPGPEK